MSYANPHYWLGFMGQSLADIIVSYNHEEAVDLARRRLAMVVANAPIEDGPTKRAWQETLVQVPGATQKEE